MQEQVFTNDELRILSDGILSLVRNTNNAINLMTDKAVIKALEDLNGKYKELNCKVCMMIK